MREIFRLEFKYLKNCSGSENKIRLHLKKRVAGTKKNRHGGDTSQVSPEHSYAFAGFILALRGHASQIVVTFSYIFWLLQCKSINNVSLSAVMLSHMSCHCCINEHLFIHGRHIGNSSSLTPFPDYLCSPEDNVYNIDFTRFKIRDMETGTVLFEITKPPVMGESE